MSKEKSGYVAKGLALVPTYRCPGRCDHCNIDFENIDKWPELPADAAVRVMEEAQALGLSRIQFCGGEPTLRPEFMLKVVKTGRKMGKKFHRPPTTGWLGEKPHELESFLLRLRDAGYTSGFRLSVDHYHRRVPLESAANFIRAYSRVFPIKTLSIGCCDADRDRSARILRELAGKLEEQGLPVEKIDNKHFKTARGRISLGLWTPTRPTWKPLDDSHFEFKPVSFERAGEKVFSREAPIQPFGCLGSEGVGYLWVEPDGAVRACCGNANCFIDRLVIGNALKESLETILLRAKSDPLLQVLAEGGPVALAARLPDDEKKKIAETKFTHRCELCYYLLMISNNFALHFSN